MIDVREVPVYVISIPKTNRSRIYFLLKGAGFRNVKFSDGVKRRKKSEGVALAHKAALGKALAECEGPFIIIEDDVAIRRTNPEVFVPEDADAVYLGLSTWGLKNGRGVNGAVSFEKFNGGVFKLKNMLAAHAVLYTNHEYARFLRDAIDVFIEIGTNQDKMRAETLKYWDVYALAVPIFYQTGRYEKYTDVKLSKLSPVPLINFYL